MLVSTAVRTAVSLKEMNVVLETPIATLVHSAATTDIAHRKAENAVRTAQSATPASIA